MRQADQIDIRLLNDFQRDFPLLRRPFHAIGAQLEISEDQVLARLRDLRDSGRISRVGATCRPNTVGASTLAAVAAPEGRIEEVAGIIGAEPGVNHSYLREDRWNIWFVATAPGPDKLRDSLARIEAAAGLPVLSLPLMRAFNIDLGFDLVGAPRPMAMDRDADLSALQPEDRAIMQWLSTGLPLIARPFAQIAEATGHDEDHVITRIGALASARLLNRVGVIVRHRKLGWTENAMVVWRPATKDIAAAGRALNSLPGVTLCYQRRTVPGLWDYPLFCMIHARSRDEAGAIISRARALPPLRDAPHKALFSTRCFKQRGALIGEAAA